MRNPQGFAVITSPEPSKVYLDKFQGKAFRCENVPAGTLEIDTYTCCHCNTGIHVKPKVSMDEFGSMCRNCMKMTCPTCANGPCVPFMKKLELAEAKDRARRSYEF